MTRPTTSVAKEIDGGPGSPASGPGGETKAVATPGGGPVKNTNGTAVVIVENGRSVKSVRDLGDEVRTVLEARLNVVRRVSADFQLLRMLEVSAWFHVFSMGFSGHHGVCVGCICG